MGFEELQRTIQVLSTHRERKIELRPIVAWLVWKIIEESDPRMRVMRIFEPFRVTPILVSWIEGRESIACTIPQSVIDATIWQVIKNMSQEDGYKMLKELVWGIPELVTLITNQQVRDALVGENIVKLKNKATVLSPDELENFVNALSVSHPEKNKNDIRNSILGEIKKKYGQFTLQAHEVEIHRWYSVKPFWLDHSFGGLKWFSVNVLLSMANSTNKEKGTHDNFDFSIEVLGQKLEWKRNLHITLGYGREDEGDSHLLEKRMTFPLVSYRWRARELVVSPHTRDHSQNTHTELATHRDRYGMTWFKDQETYEWIIALIESWMLEWSIIDEIRRGSVLIQTVALRENIGYVSMVRLQELREMFGEEIKDDLDQFLHILKQEHLKMPKNPSLEKPDTIQSLYDCMRRWSPRYWRDDDIENYLSELNRQLSPNSRLRFICRPRSEWVAPGFLLDGIEWKNRVTNTNLLRIVKKHGRLLTVYPISFRETLRESAPFIWDKFLKTLEELKRSIDFWYPLDLMQIPIFLMVTPEKN